MQDGPATLDPWYVTGFCEGAATFTFNRSRKGLTLVFAVKLTASERPVLEALQRFFAGAGRIYEVRAVAPRSPRQGYTKAACLYRVARLEQLEAVIRHFTAHPLHGSRRNTFALWSEMVALKRDNFRHPPLARLHELADQLSARAPRKQVRRVEKAHAIP